MIPPLYIHTLIKLLSSIRPYVSHETKQAMITKHHRIPDNSNHSTDKSRPKSFNKPAACGHSLTSAYLVNAHRLASLPLRAVTGPSLSGNRVLVGTRLLGTCSLSPMWNGRSRTDYYFLG